MRKRERERGDGGIEGRNDNEWRLVGEESTMERSRQTLITTLLGANQF